MIKNTALSFEVSSPVSPIPCTVFPVSRAIVYIDLASAITISLSLNSLFVSLIVTVGSRTAFAKFLILTVSYEEHFNLRIRSRIGTSRS